jgi:hypothetical protein
MLSIDYESWFALFRRYDQIIDPEQRRALDDHFSRDALDPILDQLHGKSVSFYLVGEIAHWYPEVPRKIVDAGHELGLHCQVHRSLIDADELAADLQASIAWRKQYHVRGYRAPMIGISEAGYPLLSAAGFVYSSSIYAPAGTLFKKQNVWELPVSTLTFLGKEPPRTAPRNFSFNLLTQGEFPYGSSFSIGLSPYAVLKMIEHDLKRGLSPVLFLHPYELARPPKWFERTWRDVIANPLLLSFTLNKSAFLAAILKHFPVSTLGAYVDEALSLP